MSSTDELIGEYKELLRKGFSVANAFRLIDRKASPRQAVLLWKRLVELSAKQADEEGEGT